MRSFLLAIRFSTRGSRGCLALLASVVFAHPARAQVVIPHGNFDGGFAGYLIAAVSFLLLCFAVWQYWRGG